jgi:hypothetical protein
MSSSDVRGKFLLIAALILLCQATTSAQSLQRIVDKLSWQTEPVKMQKVTSNGTNINLGQRFRAEKDWLNGFAVSVQNTSNKAIARIEINLAFPRPANAPADLSTYVVPLIYGVDPAESTSESQTLLSPGGTVEVKLPQANLSAIKEDLATLQYSGEVTRVRLTLNSVTFSDGSMWAGDEILYPDPANPKQKINPRLQNGPTIQRQARRCPVENVMPTPLRALFSHARALSMQDPTTPCNTVFVTTHTNECGTTGSGCSFKINIFDDSITLLGLRNAIKQLSSTRCQNRSIMDTNCLET